MNGEEYSDYVRKGASIYVSLSKTSDLSSYVLIQLALLLNCQRWVWNIMVQRGFNMTLKLKATIEITFALLFCFEAAFLAVELYCNFSEIGGTPLTSTLPSDDHGYS